MRRDSIQGIIDYIEDNLKREITLADIGEKVGYSPYYCSVSFRRYMGTSIKGYILRRRLQKASEELIDTEDRIIDIALTYGYSTQEAFSRAFSKEFGISPNGYRRGKLPLSRYDNKSLIIDKNEKVGDGMKNDVIEKVQEDISERYQENVLHILNGSCMFDDFKKNNRMKESHTYVSFNEAMCWGNGHEKIFSKEFIRNRCESLGVKEEQYRSISLEKLKPLFSGDFDTVVLWFGDDMFCQINMLTILAYLDTIDFSGDVLFCMAIEDKDEMIPNAHEIDVQGKYDIYNSVVCNREMPKESLMPVMYQGIVKYLSYRDENSEINRYIREHINIDRRELILQLFRRFPKYGLGDMQYEMMIDEMKK